jgi:putative membrane protein
MLSTVVAAVHLLALVFGVAALLLRAKALNAAEDTQGAHRVLSWDNLYGLVALFWIGSGLYRAFGGLEKGTDYYLANHVFWLKLLLVVALFAVELPQMITFIRWRIRLGKKLTLDLTNKAKLIRLHWIEFCLIPLIVVCATFMARGVGSVRKTAPPTQPVADSAAITRGAELYRSQCATCHQLDGRGFKGKLAADFIADKRRLAKPDEMLLKSIAMGVPGTAMIGFSGRLSEAQMRDVLAFIRASFGADALTDK